MRRLFPILIVLMSLWSCESELDERYLNPDKNTSTTVDKLFTGMLANDRVWPKYWEVSTFINWHIGVYAQTVGYINTPAIYQQNESYIQDRWNDFYRPSANGSGVMMTYRQMENLHQELSAVEQERASVFMHAARVVLYDQATQMVDLWGDIPFFQAGSLAQAGDAIYPVFDHGELIYRNAIRDLKLSAEFFSSAALDNQTRALFERQDILLNGSMSQWTRYCNSLRLRLLMRLSSVDEEFAKKEVLELVGDPAGHPLLNGASYVPGHDDVLLAPLTTYTLDLHDAFNDWVNYPAPYHLLEKVLKPANDPRMEVMFDRFGKTVSGKFNPNPDYRALPMDLTRVEQLAVLSDYAILDSATFLFNNKLPGVVITAAEVNFLKSEAFERWGGGDAAIEFRTGVKNSVKFYFYLHRLNSSRATRTAPSDEELNRFVDDESRLTYSGTRTERLQKIYTQKWAHFGVLQSGQAWSEYRRTGSPSLTFPVASSDFKLPPNRLTYPLGEKNFNPNYKDVAPRDTRTAVVFWDIP